MSLASRYRPQSFAEVVGQKLAATALSRAAEKASPAPAYLLSGTRGVGKTTIARIFAKALNCENGPGPEPCNVCGACARITAGNHVDVMEIDGASNTSVEDVRALRENIGFAPMEGRFKIFIVDEAHMLSKSAFNALLKTLEEPPPRAVFIFATTEAHKFPATIISRCQHFVFRHLPESEIFDHLCAILRKENAVFDEKAVRLLARRAQGSARDSLSLTDQALALCDSRLDINSTREALGLAGEEFYDTLFAALRGQELEKIVPLCRELLHTGVDIGFFIRELAETLRNLFLLRQTGDAILPGLELTEDETAFLKKNAALFSPTHLHAAWQMTLESQRGINQSPEPGAALELLLFNLAMLPRLLPIGDVPQNLSRPAENAEKAKRVQDAASEKEQPQSSCKADSAPQARPNQAGVSAPTGLGEQTGAPYGAASAKAENLAADKPEELEYSDKWGDFRKYCESLPPDESFSSEILRSVEGKWFADRLEIRPSSETLRGRLEKNRKNLEDALAEFCGGKPPRLEFKQPLPQASRREMMDVCAGLPEVRLCEKILGATLVDCRKK